MAQPRPLARSATPGASTGQLFLAVFLLFAPMPALLMVAPQQPFGPWMVLVSALVGGLIAVSWAATFVLERMRWLAAVIPATAALPFISMYVVGRAGAGWRVAADSAGLWRLGCSLAAVASMVAAYILLVGFIRRYERAGERARAELDIAAGVHRALVPAIALRAAGAEIVGRSIASSEMGGDLIDVVPSPGGSRLDILLADVSGHGVGAGVVMAMLKSAIRTRLLREADLGEALADINRVLADLTEPHMFATLAAVRLHTGAQGPRVQFALAGHLPILHHRAAAGRWDRHPNQSLPLGVEPDEAFVTGETTVEPGDLLVLFTDGLTEVQNRAGRELGIDGFAEIAARHAGAASPLDQSHAAILAAVAAYGRAGDDQSLVLIRVV